MSFRIIRAVAGKKAGEAKRLFRKKRTRLDENLPLGVRLGCLIDVTEVALLPFKGLVQFEFPAFPLTVNAIGKIDLGDGVMAYRCYFERADAFLQLVTERGDLAECRFYTLDRDVYPASEADWDVWLNPGAGILGSPVVSHGHPEEQVYTREWLDGDGQAEPVVLTERFLNDPYGDDIVQEEQQAMSYFRVAHGDPANPNDPERIDEYLLITVGDGVVEMYLGVDFMPEEITVI